MSNYWDSIFALDIGIRYSHQALFCSATSSPSSHTIPLCADSLPAARSWHHLRYRRICRQVQLAAASLTRKSSTWFVTYPLSLQGLPHTNFGPRLKRLGWELSVSCMSSLDSTLASEQSNLIRHRDGQDLASSKRLPRLPTERAYHSLLQLHTLFIE